MLAKLVGAEPALLAALLLALDPFFIGLSRVIHHDALVSIFIVCSLLALLLYKDQARVFNLKAPMWLFVSGVSGGLGLLTKPTAFYLVVFIGLFLLFANGLPRSRSDGRRIILVGLAWIGIALAVFVILWPAMWAAPLATLTGLLDRSASAVGEDNNYALIPAPGSPLPELGFLFYPVNWLFKTTLPVLVGLIALLIGLWQGWFKNQRAGEPAGQQHDPLASRYAPFIIRHSKWLALFVLLFLLLLLPADTRDIRYFLPAALVLQIVAAIGLAGLAWRVHASGRSFLLQRPTLYTLLLLSQLALTGIYYPYFVDYLNPLAGGPWLGPRWLKIGSGEGLDQMGRYLDQKPQAQKLTTATSFWESFVPFFSGRYTKPHYDEEADYILIYLRQIQNNNPFPEYWTYFSARTPEHKVTLVGLDYAWLYPGPQLRVVRQADFGDGIFLRGYRLERPAAPPGETATLTLVWAGAAPVQSNQRVRVRLLDPAGQLWAENSGPLLDPAGPSPVEGHYRLDLPADMPRGDYPLQVSLGQASHQIGPIPVRVLDRPPAQRSLSANFGDLITLGGVDIHRVAEGVFEITLLWQAQQPIAQSYTTFVHLVAESGAILGQVDRIPRLAEQELPTNHWLPGEWVADTFELTLNPDTPPGQYPLIAGWYNGQTGERLPLLGQAEARTTVEITTLTVP
jgi:hypothetical protein